MNPETWILESIYWFLIALSLALFEIQIEGKHGWAEDLPTWRIFTDFSEKPLTGYHLYLTGFLLLVFHLPFLFIEWSHAMEAVILSHLTLVGVFWDFLWFVLNPDYGLGKFHREEIWWHSSEYWFMDRIPTDYILGIIASGVLALHASTMRGNPADLLQFGFALAVFLILTALTVKLAPRYQKFHENMPEEYK